MDRVSRVIMVGVVCLGFMAASGTAINPVTAQAPEVSFEWSNDSDYAYATFTFSSATTFTASFGVWTDSPPNYCRAMGQFTYDGSVQIISYYAGGPGVTVSTAGSSIIVAFPLAVLPPESVFWEAWCFGAGFGAAGYYTYQDRNEFLKLGVFLEMGGSALEETGLDTTGNSGIVCFSREQTTGVIKHCRTRLVKWR